MNTHYPITDVVFTAGSPRDERSGLVGYVSFKIGHGLLVDGATVRRSLAGRLGLVFPARRDKAGRRRYSIRPADDATREDLEAQILGALREQGVLR